MAKTQGTTTKRKRPALKVKEPPKKKILDLWLSELEVKTVQMAAEAEALRTRTYARRVLLLAARATLHAAGIAIPAK